MNLEMRFQKEKHFQENYVTTNLLECVKFWNREGKKAIDNNKNGIWGSKKTNELARTMEADDFLLHMILSDCQTFCGSNWAKESGIKFECGRTRSHVWIHMNNERVLMIYF